jgi:hypothetical protein
MRLTLRTTLNFSSQNCSTVYAVSPQSADAIQANDADVPAAQWNANDFVDLRGLVNAYVRSPYGVPFLALCD